MSKKPFTKKQLKYIELLADPTNTHTEDEMAEIVGVSSRSTLWRWRQEPGFYEEVRKMGEKNIQLNLGAIYSRLAIDARKGGKEGNEAAKIIFDYILGLAQTKNINVSGTVKTIGELSDKELENEINKLIGSRED